MEFYFKFLPELGPGQTVQVKFSREVGHTEHKEKVVQEIINCAGCVDVEEGVVRCKGNGYENEGARDNDDGDCDRRGFLITAVFPVLSSRREFCPGFFNGDG